MDNLNQQQTATATSNANVSSINVENSGSLDTLSVGNSLLVNIIQVKKDSNGNEQFQIELAEKKQKGVQISSVLSRANRYNDAFKARAQRAYELYGAMELKEDLGIDVMSRLGDFVAENVNGKTKMILPLNILNPVFLDNKKRLRVQRNEYINPLKRDLDRLATVGDIKLVESIKKIPNGDGTFDYPTAKDPATGKSVYIFSVNNIVDCDPVDEYIAMESRAPSLPISATVNATASPKMVTEEQVSIQ